MQGRQLISFTIFARGLTKGTYDELAYLKKNALQSVVITMFVRLTLFFQQYSKAAAKLAVYVVRHLYYWSM